MTYWTDQGCTICCYLALERRWKLPSCEAGRQRGAGARGRSQETRHLALSPISEPCYVFFPLIFLKQEEFSFSCEKQEAGTFGSSAAPSTLNIYLGAQVRGPRA